MRYGEPQLARRIIAAGETMNKSLILTICLILLTPLFARAATINAKGASGVCVAVLTSGVTTILDFNNLRSNVTIYCSTQMNCEAGPATGGAPATTPTTGAIGTGAGFPIAANTYLDIGPSRAISPGTVGSGATLNLETASRMDCIAATANGACCTWEQF